MITELISKILVLLFVISPLNWKRKFTASLTSWEKKNLYILSINKTSKEMDGIKTTAF